MSTLLTARHRHGGLERLIRREMPPSHQYSSAGRGQVRTGAVVEAVASVFARPIQPMTLW